MTIAKENIVLPRRSVEPFYERNRFVELRGDMRFVITDPDGVIFDVTERLLSFSGVEEVVEIDLLELAHGDTEIVLDDRDGAVSKFFIGADETREWSLSIERETLRRRRKFVTVFGGIIDLPWSLKIDPTDSTVTVQVFSFSKVLENTSAEGVGRTFTGIEATASAASATVTLTTGTTDDMEIGDSIKLDDDSITEEHEILQINSSTVFVTVDNWVNAFTAKPLTLTTPFYRDKSVEFLVEELFKAAGVKSFEIDIRNQNNLLIFPSPMARSGLNAGNCDYMIDTSGKLHFQRIGDTQIWTKISTSDAWIKDGSDANDFIDWRTNQLVEPANIEPQAAFNTHNITADHVAGFSYNTRYFSGPNTLQLERDGVDLLTLETGLLLDTSASGFTTGPWTSDDYLWYSFMDDSGNKALKYRDIPGAVTRTVGSGTAASEWFGEIQNIRPLGITVFKPLYHAVYTNALADKLHVYGDPVDADPPSLLATITVPRRLDVKSMRGYFKKGIGNVVAGIYYTTDATKMRVWRVDSPEDWVEIADFTVSGTSKEVPFNNFPRSFISVFDYARNDPVNSETVFVVAIENDEAPDVSSFLAPLFFVISTQFIGVVPYADFTGLSVGGALKELALMTMSYVRVDNNRNGIFIGRAQLQESIAAPSIKVPEPFERETRPIWEFFRTSVQISGTTSDGTAVSAIAGDTGASGRRASFSSKFVNSEALAFGVATLYLGYLNQRRTEEELTFPEFDPPVGVLDKIFMDGKDYLVIEARPDYIGRTIQLRAFELKP